MAALSDKQKAQYLDAMGIQRWQLRQGAANEIENVVAESVARDANPLLLDWDALQNRVAACVDCELHCQRSQSVFGVGNRNADWLIIGEAPAADEDEQGEPFVGRAGQLLSQMLLAMGLKREQVYITNIVKCRPPQDRDPNTEEAGHCVKYLRRQIELLQPKLILTIGAVATQNLLNKAQRIGELRGQQFEYADTGIPVVATYHPAYLLRAPTEKRKAWEDLLFAQRIIANL